MNPEHAAVLLMNMHERFKDITPLEAKALKMAVDVLENREQEPVTVKA